jgi:hypothetical protein
MTGPLLSLTPAGLYALRAPSCSFESVINVDSSQIRTSCAREGSILGKADDIECSTLPSHNAKYWEGG